jgi:hypothetical protein
MLLLLLAVARGVHVVVEMLGVVVADLIAAAMLLAVARGVGWRCCCTVRAAMLLLAVAVARGVVVVLLLVRRCYWCSLVSRDAGCCC